MNKNYISGRNAEYRAIRRLKQDGAVVAHRSAGSHSLFDVFALMGDGSARFVQVKAGSSPLKYSELANLPHKDNVSLELWHWVDGQFVIYR